jgi:uncharacterized protein YecE (DUF72 family)
MTMAEPAAVPSVRVGTSGWSYPSGRGTWNGLFYPTRGAGGFCAADELPYYAEHFDTVEVNSTFYRAPAPATSARWARETPGGFAFSVKLHQRFSHVRPVGHLASPPSETGTSVPAPSAADADAFRRAVGPIGDAGKLGAVLVQFPPAFHRDDASVAYLGQLLATFREYPMAVELRHRSWSDAAAQVAAQLDEFQAAWVLIDEPKFASSIRQDLAQRADRCSYLRLHGRNAAQWWTPDAPEDRYNYLYSTDELWTFAALAATPGARARKTYVYLNNHFAAKSVVNAAILKHLLGQPVTGAFRPELLGAYPTLRPIVPVERGLF